ncbi:MULTISPECIES: helix-turn-helix domain-containing protein [Sphingobacterium]|uniref:XRE family transcriptional regulator n=3 Tax=Sphingobacterium TaxID=28453 RepID=A0ACD5C2V4_9SPHI|nr:MULTISPECIES: XRE family transcriptional regulator [Sphingobacterium]APU99849.1 XRE family transcriptional regulator [Sphingobacterium sp. B29]MBB1643989.1 XRE family transcriptional regulator [Sphingobacterium sp. UME9]QQT28813.1 helix-turn-helix transcriptional regulator [Sphingobacterium multivorum]QRY60375.1 helix-turn-helix transcriptional regulator [Sphingobacterium siyangense]RKF42503.1 XRE family transcriptional regulator [Sphingobacterium siyangense]
MEDNTIFKISNKIKEIRKEKGITIQEVADRAGVSKGLISQIENNRTIPSLLVLINIINALNIDLNEFFKDFNSELDSGPVVVRKKDTYSPFEKESAIGFHYKRIFTSAMDSSTMDIVLLELLPDAQRPMVETEAYEYKYIISGQVEYIFNDQKISLEEGDSIFFNGRLSHTPRNVGSEKAVMLIVYFFENKK